MNRRTAALSASAIASLVLMTGCGAMGSSVNPSARGMVIEQEKDLTSTGGTKYTLKLTTDRKSIRRQTNRNTKTKEITVSASVWKNCGLKEMYPACK
jgi:hypothetical protein